ncbi:DUF1697 domain-containing protein [Fulvivirgaceae bacterium LMO-SS25]
MAKFIAFLRGINVGGNHKVPMQELKDILLNMGFENIITLLNSGNVIFQTKPMEIVELESQIAQHLNSSFGFPIPVIIRSAENLKQLIQSDPFKGITVTKETRLYLSFLRKSPQTEIPLPWVSEDKSFQILNIQGANIISILDLSIGKTVKGMDALEKLFGEDITTRNWNTILRIGEKL